jgi:RHS repeat-associated protein
MSGRSAVPRAEDSGEFFEKILQSPAITRYYYANGKRIAMLTGATAPGSATRHFIVEDNLGSTVLMTDANAAVEGRLRYFPYGSMRYESWAGGVPLTDKLFTGQQRESELGLYNYVARFYSNAVGRFPQADTIVPEPADPRAYNRYAYVYNSPANFTDPSGHCIPDITCSGQDDNENTDQLDTQTVPLPPPPPGPADIPTSSVPLSLPDPDEEDCGFLGTGCALDDIGDALDDVGGAAMDALEEVPDAAVETTEFVLRFATIDCLAFGIEAAGLIATPFVGPGGQFAAAMVNSVVYAATNNQGSALGAIGSFVAPNLAGDYTKSALKLRGVPNGMAGNARLAAGIGASGLFFIASGYQCYKSAGY